MLTINDFDKAEETSTRSNRRAVKMTPKKPIAGLDNLEISLFTTGFKRGDSVIWGWLWWANNNQSYDSSEGKDGGPPSQEYFNIESAALAAIKSASYWSDDERLPREEREKQERQRKQQKLDNQVNRFLNS